MDIKILQDIGLTEPQAKAYLLLVKHGSLKPPVIAQKLGVTRTNAYKVFDQLEEFGLAKKLEQDKKLTYTASHPTALEHLAETKRKAAAEHEKQVKAAIPSLLNYFFTFSEQPGVRYFQGKEGIETIYKEQLRDKQDLYIIRSWKDREFFGKGVYNVWRKRPSTYGIPTTILSPDVPDANNDPDIDKKYLFDRTWMKQEDYTAPVEWNIFGSKVSVISFGEEAMGLVIDSPQIAESLRQLFCLMQQGLRATPDYEQMPLLAKRSEDISTKDNPEW